MRIEKCACGKNACGKMRVEKCAWKEREEHKSENWFIMLKTCSISRKIIDHLRQIKRPSFNDLDIDYLINFL